MFYRFKELQVKDSTCGMSGAPTLEQLKTVEIFRKKIIYLEHILNKFYTFKCSRGDTLYYRKLSPLENEDESEELALKFWWNQEDIIVNKTDMNDFAYSKYIKKTEGGRFLCGANEVSNLWSKFAPHCVISSPQEVLQYDPFEA